LTTPITGEPFERRSYGRNICWLRPNIVNLLVLLHSNNYFLLLLFFPETKWGYWTLLGSSERICWRTEVVCFSTYSWL